MTPETKLPRHVAENRRFWDQTADAWVASGHRSWAADEPFWGEWHLPESELSLLPKEMTGMRAIELGAGTAYICAWMARRGATVTGIDNSARQLETAQALCASHGVSITLLHGNAEQVPAADASFDFAISEYGAAIWCDPYAWIPEAHRLLRPGGRLVFLGHHPLAMVCTPPSGAHICERLGRPYFGMHELDWSQAEIDPGGVEYNLPISAWLRLFADVGFEIEAYLELQAPQNATQTRFQCPAEWAKQWPSEQVWKLRKR